MPQTNSDEFILHTSNEQNDRIQRTREKIIYLRDFTKRILRYPIIVLLSVLDKPLTFELNQRLTIQSELKLGSKIQF